MISGHCALYLLACTKITVSTLHTIPPIPEPVYYDFFRENKDQLDREMLKIIQRTTSVKDVLYSLANVATAAPCSENRRFSVLY
ncbi:hypothetical protein RvY_11654 [Ramazzottius varieornatus]|uniref:Nitroreductase domain-containing protein n=1 Tax=Ramazzottius varieornatus TaxID=947166 RepID=A0A1D1VGT5_RAMVA|nr:hypothetical protein RvY_11654 [Ramazzottius varieornatus]